MAGDTLRTPHGPRCTSNALIGARARVPSTEDPRPARVRAPVAYDAYLHVTNVDALAAELRAHGAAIREGPVDRSYQMREVIVTDLNGLVLAFGEEEVLP